MQVQILLLPLQIITTISSTTENIIPTPTTAEISSIATTVTATKSTANAFSTTADILLLYFYC